MLIRFAVQNFMSFKEPTEFNMSASKITRHSSHVVEIHEKKILRSSFIFGANASGKTNLIRAIAFAKNIVLHGFSATNFDKKYFRIDDSCKTRPGVFQFDIFSGGHFYSYGFAISYLDKKIIEEWLYQVDTTDVCIYLRSTDENGNMLFSSDITFSSTEQENRFKVYSEDIKKTNMNQTLFLSDILLRTSEQDKEFQPFRDVYRWFQKLILVFPDSHYGEITQLVSNDSSRQQLSQLLAHFDTGISGIETIEKEIDTIFSNLPPKVAETIKADLVNELSKKTHRARIEHDTALIEITLKEGTLYSNEIMSNHGNSQELFEFKDESDGTKRLINLIPLFQHALNEHVIVVDELDRSLHTKATLEFIRHFYTVTEHSNTQLIATTHDSSIMDLDFLRQDEIWFIERQTDQSSHVFSLNKFKARFDKKVEKDYLLGRYGAIPIFNDPLILLDKGEEGASSHV